MICLVPKKLNTLPSKTNNTRSYPSGHSTQARLVARIMAKKYPEHEIEFLKAGDEMRLSIELLGEQKSKVVAI